MIHAMHDSVTDRPERGKQRVRLEPVHQECDRRALVRRIDFDRITMPNPVPRFVDVKDGAAHADARQLAIEQFTRYIAGVVDRKANARRTAIEGEHIGHAASLP